MKISIKPDTRTVRLNTLPRGALFIGQVSYRFLSASGQESARNSFVVMDPALGTAESDGVAVCSLRDLGVDRRPGVPYQRVTGDMPVIRLYITDITLSEYPS